MRSSGRPGVGQPQGGDPAWFDLYRQIRAAGKSIMACWVELDELAPLLDAVGPAGLNVLMHFTLRAGHRRRPRDRGPLPMTRPNRRRADRRPAMILSHDVDARGLTIRTDRGPALGHPVHVPDRPDPLHARAPSSAPSRA